jgi:hypothetical protein
MGFVHAPCMDLNNKYPDDIRSSVPDESQTGAGEGEVSASSQKIKTVKPDGQTEIDDAQLEDGASIEEDDWSNPDYQKLTEQLEKIETMLPPTMREVVSLFSEPHEKLMVLFGLVTTMGSLSSLSHVSYANRKNYACLMTLILMPPASGKGVISLIRKLYSKVDAFLQEAYKFQMGVYKVKMQEFKRRMRSGEEVDMPKRPDAQLLLTPGNITSSMMIQLLSEVEGKHTLVQIETEADVLSTNSKSEHFALNSTSYRQIFHHEPVSLMRRGNQELLVCNEPKLCMLLTGTHSQAAKLLKSASDGLVSRFMAINGAPPIKWKDVSSSESSLDSKFEELSSQVFEAWSFLRERKIEVRLTKKQWELINSFGEDQLPRTLEFLGGDATSITKRHANMVARIALTLTLIRIWDQRIESNSVECTDDDFKTALWVMQISYESAISLYKSLPGSESAVEEGTKKYELYQRLPLSFSFADIKPLLHDLKISNRTANRYLLSLTKAGLLVRLSKGCYEKK